MAGSTTFDTGSGNFTVPTYGTLTVETWGGGAGSYGASSGAAPAVAGSNGTDTTATIGSTVLTAGKGFGGGHFYTDIHGVGGTASGGDVNTPGGDGGGGGFGSNAQKGGAGGDAPNGGLGGAAVATQSIGFFSGNNGAAPGGGGSGVKRNPDAANRNWGNGSGSGAYSKKVYTFGVTSGYPAVGSSIAYSVGPGGAGGVGTDDTGGSGAAGRVKFTWTDAPDDATIATVLSALTQSVTAAESMPSTIAMTLSALAQEIDIDVSPVAAIAMTLAGFSQEIDDAEEFLSGSDMTLFGIVQEADATVEFPSTIDQVFAGFAQEMDDAEEMVGAIDMILPAFSQDLESYSGTTGTIDTMLFGLMQEADAYSGDEEPTDADAIIATVLHGFFQEIRVIGPVTRSRVRPGESGINKPRMSHTPPVSNAELEFFRARVYARGVDGMVPPTVIAQRSLTTIHSPKSRPAVVPIPRGKHK